MARKIVGVEQLRAGKMKFFKVTLINIVLKRVIFL